MQQNNQAHTDPSGVTNKLFYPAVILGSLSLLIPAFYNHYPLVNPDTATYLASGFKPETPFDRPITYGLLARLFSANGLSLWLVIFFQAYIVSWLIFKIIRGLLGRMAYVAIATAVVILLSVTTSLSWLVCQVQPDVFTSVAFLCVAVLLMGKEDRANNLLLYVLFFVAVAVHMSHPLLCAGAALCLMLTKRLYTPRSKKKPAHKLLVLLILSVATIGVMGAALSKSKHVFFTGSLLTKGVAQQYLAENCATRSFKLCEYRHELTTDSDYFMWNPESPLYKIGGWQDSKQELTRITNDVLTTPRYLQLYFKATAVQSARQALTFGIGGGNEPLDTASNVGRCIATYFPREILMFSRSRQNTQNLHLLFTIPNKLFSVIVAISFLFLCSMIPKWKTLQPRLKVIVTVCITGIILNVVDCAAFGILHERYGAKMIWLLPMCVMMYLTTLNSRNNTTKNKQGSPIDN